MPPNYCIGRARSCIRHISDIILDIKDKVDDPLIHLAGDFNQWDVVEALVDYPDISENSGGPTRKDRTIDRCLTNFYADIIETKVLRPLETEANDVGYKRKSDHRIVLTCASIDRIPLPNWKKITFRPYHETGAASFESWANSQNWEDVLLASGTNNKTNALQFMLDDAMNCFFPEKTIRRKDGDLPWLTEAAVKKIRKKKAVFKDEGRSPRWMAIRDNLDRYLAKRQEKFLDKQRDNLLGPSASRNFFNNVKTFHSAERPKTFNIKELKPNLSDLELAEDIASFFNRISDEFEPINPFTDVPSTYRRDLPVITPSEIELLLRRGRKTKSMVDGDIFPALTKRCSASLSHPLADIFNEITRTKVWPIAWKKEIVTVIPKKNIPESYADLRNVCCTKYFSKLYEAFVLTWAKEEFELKANQFGGTKGCSTAHMLITIWDEICDNCEDYRSATVLTAIDYAKAFNRVSYQHCLKALEKKGASTDIIRLIATFLTNRTMSVKIGRTRSKPRDVNGGCPQGSILGVFLFNTTTDDLEDEILPPDSNFVRHDNSSDTSLENSAASPAPMASSPSSQGARLDCTVSPLGGGRYRVKDLEVVFERGARNISIEYSDEGIITPPKESSVGTQVLVDKDIIIVKYVDDNISIERLNFGETSIIVSPDGKAIKVRLAPKTQNAFRSVTSRAGKKGMVVNTRKTQMLVISDALNYTPHAFIHDREGNCINDGETMKVLGFTFSSKPTMHAHVNTVLKRIRQKYWSLRHLKKIGFTPSELVKVYKTIILPCADYCDVVYHSLLTDEHDELLERAQVGALRTIFDYKLSGRKLRETAAVPTLRQCRIEHCDKFANKCLNSKFSHWFPRNTNRATRNTDQFLEKFARCDRLRNSPLHYMRRRLNGKEGRKYGERNRSFREA